ncbi:MAG: flippase-like domain-containing protein [Polyangiaceae bacterium]|nr:flippase-like domain-containing protein [Polyangiaceae bacterium]
MDVSPASLAPPAPARSPARRGLARGTWVRLALGVLGLAATALVVAGVGAELVWRTLEPALPWVPVLCLLELGRIACETVAAHRAFGARARDIPLRTLFRANLVGLSLGALAPAPRVVNETIKATMLAPHVGVPVATSAGLAMQAATLVSVGLFSIPCGVAILALGGASVWFWAALLHAVVLVGSGLALRLAMRARGPARSVARRFPRLAPGIAELSGHARLGSAWLVGPTLALVASRLFQVGQLAIGACALGASAGFAEAFAAEGVNLVALAVGVLVPGGFGATDGAFTLAAELLGTDAARATSLALLLRSMQLVWLLVASLVLFVDARRRSA